MSKPLPTRPDQPAGQKQPSAAAPAPKPKPPRKPSPWPWGPWRRLLVSLLVLFHVTAVFSAPWAIQLSDILEPALPPGRIPRNAQGRAIPIEQLDINQYPPQRPILPVAIASCFWHYANLLYINNGYDFFSPDPGVSHQIRYEVFDDAGASIVKGEMPNRFQQWPRLFYHRHMMLVEQSSDPRHADSGWELKIAERLLAKYNGARVRLVKVRHHLLTPAEVLAERRLNEDATYEIVGELDHRRGDPAAVGAEPRVVIPGGAR